MSASGQKGPPIERIAVLGTGIMGSAFARRAIAAGLEVSGWSRPLADAERLASTGMRVEPTAAAAVRGAELVVTMVPDAPAIESFALGPDGFLDAMERDAIWVQSSTVGVGPADRLIALAAEHGVTIVDAPVLGSKEPAEEGRVVTLASGEQEAIERCEPYLKAISRRTVQLGPAGAGSRMKMVTNHWIMCAVASIAETVAFSEALGLDARQFLDALSDTQMDMGYAQIKGRMMIERRYPAQGNLAIGAKDAALAHTAARELGLPARVSGATTALLQEALALCDGSEDMAAAFEAARVASERPG